MLTLKEIQTLLSGVLLTPGVNLDGPCSKVFASDLMSDVLAFMDPGSLLVTGLVNAHVVRTAHLAEASAVVIVQGKRPERSVMEEAGRNNVPIIATSCSMFEACARISGSWPKVER